MEKEISIQVHDYDANGYYRIVLDDKASVDEVWEWRKKARESVKLDWDSLPKEATHIVYYAELVDRQNCVCFVGIYMHGEAYDENEFERTFQTREDIGYVGAFHKRV